MIEIKTLCLIHDQGEIVGLGCEMFYNENKLKTIKASIFKEVEQDFVH